MVDRLNSLRHYTIISGNYKNRNIRRVRTTHTHCSKSLMSRCVQECNLLTIYCNNRSTNVLCNTTGLTVDHIRMTDCVQKRSLTMVNVSHNTYNRRTFLHLLFVFFFLFQEFFNYIYNFFFLAEYIKLKRNLFCCIIINLLINSYDLALHKELLNNNRWYDLHLICQFFDCKDLRDYD